MFGSNNWGQLGLGSKVTVNKPTCVKGRSLIKFLVPLLVRTDGDVCECCWLQLRPDRRHELQLRMYTYKCPRIFHFSISDVLHPCAFASFQLWRVTEFSSWPVEGITLSSAPVSTDSNVSHPSWTHLKCSRLSQLFWFSCSSGKSVRSRWEQRGPAGTRWLRGEDVLPATGVLRFMGTNQNAHRWFQHFCCPHRWDSDTVTSMWGPSWWSSLRKSLFRTRVTFTSHPHICRTTVGAKLKWLFLILFSFVEACRWYWVQYDQLISVTDSFDYNTHQHKLMVCFISRPL